ncbi:hypothetical protein IC582_002585 [Cucumis melo]
MYITEIMEFCLQIISLSILLLQWRAVGLLTALKFSRYETLLFVTIFPGLFPCFRSESAFKSSEFPNHSFFISNSF